MNSFGLHLDNSEEQYFSGVMFKGGGGGGSSGKVDYPEYMKTQHTEWLGDLDTLINNTNSPYLGETAYDPTSDLNAMIAGLTTFSNIVTAVNHEADWVSAVDEAVTKADAVLTDAHIDAEIQAYGDILTEEIRDNVLPEFQAGMLTTNCVLTSAFVMGEAKIWGGFAKELNKTGAQLKSDQERQRTQFVLAGTEQMMRAQQVMLELDKVVASLTADIYRIKIVAGKEEVDTQIDIDEKDARWAFDKYQYGVDMLGGIGGGTVGAGGPRPSTAESAIGGGLSGAAAGAMVGGPMGAAVGGVLGAAASFL